MTQKLIYENQDGAISVVHPAPGVALEAVIASSVPVKVLKAGIVHTGVAQAFNVEVGAYIDARLAAANGLTVQQVPYKLVEESEIPTCRMFRSAWRTTDETPLVEDAEVAKEVAHDLRRAKREEEFAPLDKAVVIATANPEALAEAEAARQEVRDRYAVIQTEIDACADCQALRDKLAEHSLV